MRATLLRIGLLVLVLLFYRRVLFSEAHHIPWDLPNWHLPQAVFQAREIAQGRFPLWDPWTYSGRPFAANPQTQSFYPPRLLTLWLAGDTEPARLLNLLDWELVLHVWMAGLWAMSLARRLGSCIDASFFTGAMYSLGCYFASQAQHIGAVETAAWLPACWLGILTLREGWKLWAFATPFAMALLSGFTPLALIVAGSSLLLALTYRGAMRSIAGLLAGVLLSAVMLFPALQLSMHSIARYRSDWRGTGGGIPLIALRSLIEPWHNSVFDSANYKLPYDITFVYIYCGYFGLALAIWGTFRTKRWPLMAVLGISSVWMFGDSLPSGAALFAMIPPLLRGGFYPLHFLAVFSLVIAVFAGVGLDKLPVKSRLAVALLASADLILVGSSRPFNDSTEPVNRKASIDCKQSVAGPRSDVADYANVPRTIQAPLSCVPSANGYDPMALSRYIDVRLLMAKGARWGATYPIERAHDPLSRFLSVNEVWSTSGDRMLDPLPRFFLVKQVQGVNSAPEALRGIGRGDWDPRSIAYVEGSETRAYSAGTVRIVRHHPDEIRLRVRTDNTAFLVGSEVNYPGWTASIANLDLPVRDTNAAFRGLQVPSGDHEVIFRFAPALQYWSAWVSLLTAAGLLISFLRDANPRSSA